MVNENDDDYTTQHNTAQPKKRAEEIIITNSLHLFIKLNLVFWFLFYFYLILFSRFFLVLFCQVQDLSKSK